MRIRWIGVPKDARPTIRKELREKPGDEFLVCSDKGRDQEIRKNVRESLWAFNASFIASHARGSLDSGAIKALKEAQEKLCESANELVFSMIRSFKSFCEDAVRADGYGHFLSPYDGEEDEIDVKPNVLDRLAADPEPKAQTFYAYRL